jgi:hypothetical protein
MVVEPEPSWKCYCKRCKTNRANECEEIVEDGYCFREYEGNGAKAECAGSVEMKFSIGIGKSQMSKTHSQVPQWTIVFDCKCLVLRRMRTKRYLAAT